ncbi:Transcription-repair-coupling factor [Galdieria sulphuraria]|uniref:Transcription-repair coupling factor (Superfamily II helicase) n=1 Tax=Galdieria sulphuraria TaxID=130081 RepID=M2XJ56_GALSU|nr:transcription-repair coupling factor (superfamily II helicase) [Galdieria sulphuraria]EME30142.1 transcription-repair coupling factor (superfamily II helicase) [Galdieria sulphuraria]GJD11601.1 Transcription-repair-coupling factor [Galdieria sulphuraria]|eukprot:XP_005706662.1 transcription-repair coupling factor (superfamily II helicase) [Galdieria sulphuraria]
MNSWWLNKETIIFGFILYHNGGKFPMLPFEKEKFSRRSHCSRCNVVRYKSGFPKLPNKTTFDLYMQNVHNEKHHTTVYDSHDKANGAIQNIETKIDAHLKVEPLSWKQMEADRATPGLSILPGDYVVHMKFGVGIFKGTEYKSKDNTIYREYFIVQYRDGKLNIPVERANEIHRFRSRESVAVQRVRAPRLDSLRKSSSWEKRKKKALVSIDKLAVDIVKLYAIRAEQKRPRYPADDILQANFIKSFPFELTPDQLACIEDIRRDMCERDSPMDRLVCGDVGFGKTEVAMQAIFRAFRAGKQVAFICPTTVLASQHYRTLQNRMEDFGVKVALLSRHFPKRMKERRQLQQDLSLGHIDVLVGTQSLLSNKLEFAKLSLLIIDEEQWLGVNQKERLKTISTSIDVLTLSATPIPRTLHMAVGNIRDMSLILTPPKGRLAVENFVLAFDDPLVDNHIGKELARNGQVYIVCPRIADIDRIGQLIKQKFPHYRILYADGTMKDVEDRILSFSFHEYDILISTCIIEAGVDIPDANTIIVYRATSFGLSQLYQIRGRVGRSKVQAFAIFTFDPKVEMTNEATERLKALEQLSSLGSGYEVANRDLEIRGPGSLIGIEQSGEVGSIGFEMYMNLLKNTLDRLRGKLVPVVEDCEVNVTLPSYIPESYIKVESERMAAYRTLGQVTNTKEMDWLENTWKYNYGECPSSVSCLFQVSRIQLLARKVGISAICIEEDFVQVVVEMEKLTWDCLCATVFHSVENNNNSTHHEYLRSFVLVREEKERDPLENNIIAIRSVLRSTMIATVKDPERILYILRQVLQNMANVAEKMRFQEFQTKAQ